VILTIDDGELRCIVSNDADAPELCELFNAPIQRASSIEPIQDGSKRGWWHVDLTPLFVTTGDVKYACCLLQLFPTRSQALKAEVDWLEVHFLGVREC
jgi:hypothetical protein